MTTDSMAIIPDTGEAAFPRSAETLPGIEDLNLKGRRSPEREEAAPKTRPGGDHVNRFLLCALVRESARSIKVIADKAGEHLPMSMITRSVLRSYRAVAKNNQGPLAAAQPDLPGLLRLNRAILKAEIASMSRERVKRSEARLADAKRGGDVTRITAEKEQLEQAIATRTSMARKFDFNQ